MVRWASRSQFRMSDFEHPDAWLRASSHDVTSIFVQVERTAAWSSEVTETLRLCARSRSNVLLIGSAAETERAIVSITGRSASTLPAWSAAGGPQLFPDERPRLGEERESPSDPVTVVVHDVQALDPAGQQRLHDWLAEHAGTMRVIATATALLHPMVERRELLEALYYRLNIVCIDLWR